MSNVTAVPIQPIKRSIVIWIIAGILVAAAVGIGLAVWGTGPVVAEKATNEQFLVSNGRKDGVVTTASGLQYQVLEKGAGGANPTDADVALIEYTGTLRDGSTFDASQRPTPLPVAGSVPGFSEALKLMTKGAKYRLWIKPELGYGAEEKRDPTGRVVLPANALLVFEVKLVDFLPLSVVQQMQAQQGAMGAPGGAPGGPGTPPPGMPQ